MINVYGTPHHPKNRGTRVYARELGLIRMTNMIFWVSRVLDMLRVLDERAGVHNRAGVLGRVRGC